MLSELRAQQTAQFQPKVVILAILIIITVNKVILPNLKYYIRNFWLSFRRKICHVMIPFKKPKLRIKGLKHTQILIYIVWRPPLPPGLDNQSVWTKSNKINTLWRPCCLSHIWHCIFLLWKFHGHKRYNSKYQTIISLRSTERLLGRDSF